MHCLAVTVGVSVDFSRYTLCFGSHWLSYFCTFPAGQSTPSEFSIPVHATVWLFDQQPPKVEMRGTMQKWGSWQQQMHSTFPHFDPWTTDTSKKLHKQWNRSVIIKNILSEKWVILRNTSRQRRAIRVNYSRLKPILDTVNARGHLNRNEVLGMKSEIFTQCGKLRHHIGLQVNWVHCDVSPL